MLQDRASEEGIKAGDAGMHTSEKQGGGPVLSHPQPHGEFKANLDHSVPKKPKQIDI